MDRSSFYFKKYGVEMEAHETPWDTKALGFPAGRITKLHGRDVQISQIAFSDLFAWASTSEI